MAASNDQEKPKKKRYVKPDLDFATVYEASGAAGPTCCKVTVATCATSTRSAVGKSVRTANNS